MATRRKAGAEGKIAEERIEVLQSPVDMPDPAASARAPAAASAGPQRQAAKAVPQGPGRQQVQAEPQPVTYSCLLYTSPSPRD